MSEASLNASFWVMVMMQTIGSFDPMPGTGPRKMPAPKAYVTTIIAWAVLQLAADAGYEEPAARFGWLIVLVSLVVGPFGKRVVKLLEWVAKAYGNVGPGPGSNSSGSSASTTSINNSPLSA